MGQLTNVYYLFANNTSFYSAGLGSSGQYGDGTFTNQGSAGFYYNPVYAGPLPGGNFANVKQLSSGNNHFLVLLNDGTVYGCGLNTTNQLGLGTPTNKNVLTLLPISNVKMVACGVNNSLFLKYDGTIWACGLNTTGQCGNGTLTNIANITNVSSGRTYTSIGGGNLNSYAVGTDGKLYITGGGASYTKGMGSTGTDTTFVPNDISLYGVGTVIYATGGNGYSVAVMSNGDVWGCGLNSSGQYGTGGTASSSTTVGWTKCLVSGITRVACGASHTLFLKNDNTVWGCGLNSSYQLGQGAVGNKTTPISISVNVRSIACAANTSFTLDLDGSCWGCGAAPNGILMQGNGTTQQNWFPIFPAGTIRMIVDMPTDKITRYLFQDGSAIKAWNGSAWNTVGTAPATEGMFALSGMAEYNSVNSTAMAALASAQPVFLEYSQEQSVLTTLTTTFTAPGKCFKQNFDFNLTNVTSIDGSSLVAGVNGSSYVQIVVSIDKGANYYSWYGGSYWLAMDNGNFNDWVKYNGMSIATFNSLNSSIWAALVGANPQDLRFAYYIEQGVSTNTCYIDRLTLTFSMLGEWDNGVFNTDYTYQYGDNRTLVVKLISNGDFKVNY